MVGWAELAPRGLDARWAAPTEAQRRRARDGGRARRRGRGAAQGRGGRRRRRGRGRGVRCRQRRGGGGRRARERRPAGGQTDRQAPRRLWLDPIRPQILPPSPRVLLSLPRPLAVPLGLDVASRPPPRPRSGAGRARGGAGAGGGGEGPECWAGNLKKTRRLGSPRRTGARCFHPPTLPRHWAGGSDPGGGTAGPRGGGYRGRHKPSH